MQSQQSQSFQSWRGQIQMTNLHVGERSELLEIADMFHNEMTLANQHYAQGNYSLEIPPFAEVEESIRGRLAMMQYHTNRRNVIALCVAAQKNLSYWIDSYAMSFGFSLPLRWEA